MKKVLCVLLAVLMLLAIVPTAAFGTEAKYYSLGADVTATFENYEEGITTDTTSISGLTLVFAGWYTEAVKGERYNLSTGDHYAHWNIQINNRDDMDKALQLKDDVFGKAQTWDLTDDITLDKSYMVYKKNFTLTVNGNGKTVTAAAKAYAGTNTVLGFMSPSLYLTLNDLTLVADDNIRYALYLEGIREANLHNVTLDQTNTTFVQKEGDERVYGTALQANESEIHISGNFVVKVGARSWTAIDIDEKETSALLQFADGANVRVEDGRSLLFKTTNPIIRTAILAKNTKVEGKFVSGELFKTIGGYSLKPSYALNQADAGDEDVHGVLNVQVEKKLYGSGMNWFLFKRFFGPYTYFVSANTEGVYVKKIECSADGKNWKTGAIFSSELDLSKVYIRMTDSEGTVSNWLYDGKKTVNTDGFTFTLQTWLVDKGLLNGCTFSDNLVFKNGTWDEVIQYNAGKTFTVKKGETTITCKLGKVSVYSDEDKYVGLVSEDGTRSYFVFANADLSSGSDFSTNALYTTSDTAVSSVYLSRPPQE